MVDKKTMQNISEASAAKWKRLHELEAENVRLRAERDEALAQLVAFISDHMSECVTAEGELKPEISRILSARARAMLEVVKLSCDVRRLAKKGLRSPVTEEALDEAVAKLNARGE